MLNQPNTLRDARPFDTRDFDGFTIESAFLDFTDRHGRAVSVYAARCVPKSDERSPVIVHLPGGGQTVWEKDLTWLAERGFAGVSYDWAIGSFPHDPARKSKWPDGVVGQHFEFTRDEQAILPLAVQACGVVVDWIAQDPRVDAARLGVAGISWGGYLTWLVNAFEPRTKAAAPVYGCGSIFEPGHGYGFGVKGAAREYWRTKLDPSVLAEQQHAPVCFLSGTNDFFGYVTHADKLLNRLTVEHRRSCFPNNDHHLGPGEAALGVAWFNHYLKGGPAIPAEPTLDDAMKIHADPSQPVVRKEVWWSPSDAAFGPEDYRCWKRGVPKDRSQMKLAFGRVHDARGFTLNTPMKYFDSPSSASGASAVKPSMTWRQGTLAGEALDGIGYSGGLSSTQFHRTDLTITPVDGDASRSLWVVHRGPDFGGTAPVGGAINVQFRGMSDPSWNTGDFAAIELQLDLLGGEAKDLVVHATFFTPDSTRKLANTPAKVKHRRGRAVVTVKLADFADAPVGATWRDVRMLMVAGAISGNRFVVGPIRKKK